MSILRTIAMFIYLFGYMILHYGILRRAERAAAAGDTATVEQIVNQHIPRWSRGILKVTGVSLSVEGLENIPKDRPCVFVANHRSYYDIPLLLAGLEKPHGILAKEELEKIPLLNRWMKLLGCVFVQRDDVRASVRALNDATAIVESGRSFVIFPEGTRYKGEEGGAGEFKAGAFRIAVKTSAPVVPVAVTGARALFESNGNRCRPGSVRISPEEEWARIENVVKAVAEKTNLAVSIDTFYPEVAEKSPQSRRTYHQRRDGFCTGNVARGGKHRLRLHRDAPRRSG